MTKSIAIIIFDISRKLIANKAIDFIKMAILLISPLAMTSSEIINMQKKECSPAITGKFNSIKTVLLSSSLISLTVLILSLFKNYNITYDLAEYIVDTIFSNKGSIEIYIIKMISIWVVPQIIIHTASVIAFAYNNALLFIVDLFGGNSKYTPIFYWNFVFSSIAIRFTIITFMAGFIPYFINFDIKYESTSDYYVAFGIMTVIALIMWQKEKINHIRKIEIYGSNKASIIINIIRLIVLLAIMYAVIQFANN